MHVAPRDLASKTGRVWAIGDEISASRGRKATRREVVEAYVSEGGNPGTANVQYGYWSKRFDRDSGKPSSEAAPASVGEPVLLAIGDDGRVVIPAVMRRAMNLDEDGLVTAVLEEDGVLTLISRDSAIRRAQRLARERSSGGGSVVDELIAERREEAIREDQRT